MNRWLMVDVEGLKELQPEVVLRAWVRLCSNGLEAGIDAQLELDSRTGSAQEASDWSRSGGSVAESKQSEATKLSRIAHKCVKIEYLFEQ